MRVGIIVDGLAEFHSIKFLYEKVSLPCDILGVKYADMQPFAPARTIARAARGAVTYFRGKGVSHLVILIDLETRANCVGLWRDELEGAFHREYANCDEIQFRVVVKVKSFENWLVADPISVGRLNGFNISKTHRRSILPGKADRCEALQLLKRATGSNYDKVADSRRIVNIIDPDVAARNSRSFRKFMATLGHPQYAQQSLLKLSDDSRRRRLTR